MILHHTRQSHGKQVPHGLKNLENQNPIFAQTQSTGGTPSGSGLKVTRGQRSAYNSWQTSIGSEEYWKGYGKTWTRKTFNYHTKIISCRMLPFIPSADIYDHGQILKWKNIYLQ